jgi:hypothetical protein
MSGCPKGLRRSKIFFRVLILIGSLLNFNRNWNRDLIDRLLFAFFNILQLIFAFISLRIFLRLLKFFWGLLNVRLGLGKFQRKLLIFFIRFFESSIESGDLTILCLNKASQVINGSAHFGIFALRVLVIGRYHIILHLVQEFVEHGGLVFISAHKLALEKGHHFSAESLEILMICGREAATLGLSYYLLPDSCE